MDFVEAVNAAMLLKSNWIMKARYESPFQQLLGREKEALFLLCKNVEKFVF